MTYLGLDLGSKTLGLSISDRTGLIASSLEVLRYSTYDELLSMLEHVINDRKVDALVLGNPLNLAGTLSKRSEETAVNDANDGRGCVDAVPYGRTAILRRGGFKCTS